MKTKISSSSVVTVFTMILVGCYLENTVVLGGFIVVPSRTKVPSHCFPSPKIPSLTPTTATTASRIYYSKGTFENSNDPYEILNLRQSASHLEKKTLRRAYKSLAKIWHPDVITDGKSSPEEKKAANDRFAKINWAYEKLMVKIESTATRTETTYGGVRTYTEYDAASPRRTSSYPNSHDYSSRSTVDTDRASSHWNAPGYDGAAEINKEYQNFRRQRRTGTNYDTGAPKEAEKYRTAQEKSRFEAEQKWLKRETMKEETRRAAAAAAAAAATSFEVEDEVSSGEDVLESWWKPDYAEKVIQANIKFEQDRKRRIAEEERRMAAQWKAEAETYAATQKEAARMRKAQQKASFAAEQQWLKKQAEEEEARRIAAKEILLKAEEEARSSTGSSWQTSNYDTTAQVNVSVEFEGVMGDEPRFAAQEEAAKMRKAQQEASRAAEEKWLKRQARINAEDARRIAAEEARLAVEEEELQQQVSPDWWAAKDYDGESVHFDDIDFSETLQRNDEIPMESEKEATLAAHKEAAKMRKAEQEARFAAEQQWLKRQADEEEARRLEAERMWEEERRKSFGS